MSVAVPWKPRAYQKQAVKFLLEHACAGLFMDPSMGKTSIALAAFKLLRREGVARRLLVVAPLRVAQLVWPAELRKWTDFEGLRCHLLHGDGRTDEALRAAVKADTQVFVINPDGLRWLFSEGRFSVLNADTLCIDECFPAGTLITTPEGTRPIEALRAGDTVQTSSGARKISQVVRRSAAALVELTLSNGTTLRCTPEHPLFTSRGWVSAHRTLGATLYVDADLSRLQEAVQGAPSTYPTASKAEVLLAILQSETDVDAANSDETKADLQEDARQQFSPPFVEQGTPLVRNDQAEDVEDAPSPRSMLDGSRRKRDGAVALRGAAAPRAAEDVYLELRGRIGEEAARLSYELQSGLRQSAKEAGDRGGRADAPTTEAHRAGQEENQEATVIRVVRVARVELDRPADVFNLVVEDCPHYFAGGVLVHNCTKFKHTQTQRFKSLKPFLPRFQRRWGLTGSPAANGLLDLFGQCYVLDLGRSLGPYITHYRAEYFQPTGYGGYTWVLKKDGDKRIYERLGPLVLRLDADDHLDLPEVVVNQITVELPPEARRIYDAMETDLLAKLGDQTVTATNVGAALSKCRQIAAGGLYLDDDSGGARRWQAVHHAKTEAVQGLLDELQGSPALIAYDFVHDRERLLAALGPETPWLGGGTKEERFGDVERAWNQGDLPAVLVHPQSTAHGLNIQFGGHHLIWHTLTYDYELYLQQIYRLRRPGQKSKRVFVHHVVAKDTVEEAVSAALARKAKGQKALLDALRTYAKDRG